MDRFFKQLLLWFLIAALPIQGVAAVIKANCGPRHHTVSVSAAADSARAMQHMHRLHEEHDVSHIHSALEVTGTQVLTDGDSSTEPVSAGNHYTSYCSACAACCTGAVAPPVSFLAVPIPDSVEEVVISPAVSYLGFIPPSLERPPKTFSA